MSKQEDAPPPNQRPKPQPSKAQAERDQRRADALRANLKRRKAPPPKG